MRLAFVTVALLAACREPSTAPAADLRVSLTVAPAVVRAGQVVGVTVTVVNSGAGAGAISESACAPTFAVFDAHGTQVGPGGPLCAGGVASRALAPGAVYTIRGSWAASVTPGAYTVQQRVRSTDALAGSPPATLTVTP